MFKRFYEWLLRLLQEPDRPFYTVLLYYPSGRIASELCPTRSVADSRLNAAERAGKAVRGEIVDDCWKVLKSRTFGPRPLAG